MIPHHFVPRGAREIHGTEIDGVPVVWEPESSWATGMPMLVILEGEDDAPGECVGTYCWCRQDYDLLPVRENGETGTPYTPWSRYTPEFPPVRF